MDLQSLVDKFAIKIEVPGWNEGRTFWRKDLPETSRLIIENQVKDWFTNLGWKTKKGANNWFTSREGKHHTKIRWRFTSFGSAHAMLQTKTEMGGWTTENWDNSKLDELFAESATIKNVVLISKDNTPKPLPLGAKENYRVVNKRVTRMDQIYSAEAIGAVGLEKDGTISKKVALIPNEKVWFQVDCKGYSNVTFTILTDGKEFLSVKRTGKARVTNNHEMLNATNGDREIVQFAINLLFKDE